MSIEKVNTNIGKRYPHWVVAQVLSLPRDQVSEAQMGAIAEIARQVGVNAGIITAAENGAVSLSLASDTTTIDILVHNDGMVSFTSEMDANWQFAWETTAIMARKALWGPYYVQTE